MTRKSEIKNVLGDWLWRREIRLTKRWRRECWAYAIKRVILHLEDSERGCTGNGTFEMKNLKTSEVKWSDWQKESRWKKRADENSRLNAFWKSFQLLYVFKDFISSSWIIWNIKGIGSTSDVGGEERASATKRGRCEEQRAIYLYRDRKATGVELAVDNEKCILLTEY